MEILIKAGQLILSLSILIVLHEFGHYLPARWFKTRVEKFYLFFDYKFSLFKKKIGDTEWGIGWIPLGGYVKISGMIDESMDKEQMALPPQPYEFRSKPAWQRLIIMIGGVVVNLIVGVIIYIGVLLVWGDDYVAPEDIANGYSFHEIYEEVGFVDGDDIVAINGEKIHDVGDINKTILLRGAEVVTITRAGEQLDIQLPEDIDMIAFKSSAMNGITPRFSSLINSVIIDRPAKQAGLENGDRVIAVDGQEIAYWNEFTDAVQSRPNETLEIIVDRAGETVRAQVETDSLGTIGVSTAGLSESIVSHTDYTFMTAIPGGLKLGMNSLSDYVSQLKFLFTKKGAQSIGGFGAFGMCSG